MTLNSSDGFSLLEVLTVISVMVVLAGIVLPSLRIARIRAFEAKTEAQLSALELGLKLYKNDLGVFPPHLTIWHLMTGKTRTGKVLSARWRGPYLEIKDKKDFDTDGYILDAWGNKLKYLSYSVLTNGRYFDITSSGQDGRFGTADDVKLWDII